MPAAHNVQYGAPALDAMDPGAHGKHDEAPAAAYEPTGHNVHNETPGDAENVPAEQGAQPLQDGLVSVPEQVADPPEPAAQNTQLSPLLVPTVLVV